MKGTKLLLALLLGITLLASISCGDKEEALVLLQGAEWSLKDGTVTTVTWTDARGATIRTRAIAGEVQIIVDPSKMTSGSVKTLVSRNKGALFARLPAVGLYWARVNQGTEAGFIKSMTAAGIKAFPNLALQSREDPLELPKDYKPGTGRGPWNISSGNLLLDDFDDPMPLSETNDKGERLYIRKRDDGTLVTDSSDRFQVTTDSNLGASHGDITNYYRTNRNQITEETLGAGNRVQAGKVAEDFIRVAAAIESAGKSSKRIVINISRGPIDYVSDPRLADENHDYDAGWAAYNQSNNGNYLDGLNAIFNLNVPGASGVTVTWAAGNSSTDLTGTLVNALSTNPLQTRQVFAVGALDADGQIAGYSSYSTAPGTMLYIPVTGATVPVNVRTEAGVAQLNLRVPGTSFAAPQLEHLINQLLAKRPDLTPDRLRDVIFDSAVSPRQKVQKPDAPIGEMIEIPLIKDPLSPGTVQQALDVANNRFPPEATSVPKTSPATVPALSPTPTPATTPVPSLTPPATPVPSPAQQAPPDKPTATPALSAARDLTGTWKGSGVYYYVDIATGRRIITVTVDVTLEVIQVDNTVTAKMGVRVVKQEPPGEVSVKDPGAESPRYSVSPVGDENVALQGTASATTLTLKTDTAGYTDLWEFTFTTDLMSGGFHTQMSWDPPFEIKSDPKAFKLVRQRN